MNPTRYALDFAIEKTKAKSRFKDAAFDSNELTIIYLMMYDEINRRKYYNPLKKIWMKAMQFTILDAISELKTIPNN